ncbi:MAG: hypothetical protein AAFX99_27580, partial [Myxococcota bacterium]
FCFDAPTSEGLQDALHKTLETWYHDQERWKAMRRCALLRDSSWGSAAKAYLQVYQSHSEPL